MMEDKEENSYKALVKDMKPLSYKDVADDWERNASEWYHTSSLSEVKKTYTFPSKVPAAMYLPSGDIVTVDIS